MIDETTGEGAPQGAPEPASDAPAWWVDGDERPCTGCGKTRTRTIIRLNVTGRPILCDPCHSERTAR